MKSKPNVSPKAVKATLKIIALVVAIATAVVAQWETGAITDAVSFVQALAGAITNYDAEP